MVVPGAVLRAGLVASCARGARDDDDDDTFCFFVGEGLELFFSEREGGAVAVAFAATAEELLLFSLACFFGVAVATGMLAMAFRSSSSFRPRRSLVRADCESRL